MQNGAKTWKLSPKEYIVGAILAVTLRLSSTVKKFPNPPVGERTDWRSAPGDPEAKAFDHEGTSGVATAKTAPMH